MTWIAVFELSEGTVSYIHILGPAFTDDISQRSKEYAIKEFTLSPKIKLEFITLVDSLPIIAITQYLQYAIMLHCCVTRDQINISDFHYYQDSALTENNDMLRKLDADKMVDKRTNYLFEQKLLKIVEEGNINYLSEQKDSTYTGTVGKMSVEDSLRQTKNMIITLIVLCTRAAIRGGLSPEIAYTLSDNYIQNTESCKTTAEVMQISKPMQADFINRVHRYKMQTDTSPFVKMCYDYISLYVEDEFTLKDLAAYTGYAEHYLGKKFKKETGIHLKEYIKLAKIEHAKRLLLSTNQSIVDISERLHFCSPSYFTKTFREITSFTPVEYRNQT